MGTTAKKAKYGFILCIIGGIIMLISVGLQLSNISYNIHMLLLDSRVYRILGLVLGILTLRFGYLGYAGNGKTWGIVVSVFGIINLIAGADISFIGSTLESSAGFFSTLESRDRQEQQCRRSLCFSCYSTESHCVQRAIRYLACAIRRILEWFFLLGFIVSTSDNKPVLRLENLRAYYTSRKGIVRAVDDVSFDIKKGESVGLFGESGSGKTTVALAIMGVFDKMSRYYASSSGDQATKRLWELRDQARKKGLASADVKEVLPGAEGHIWFKGKDLLAMDEKEYRKIRGNEITYVPQGSKKSMNPYMTIDYQTAESLWAHDEKKVLQERQVMRRVLETLDLVELADVDIRKDFKPAQFSVGEDQRVLIAMALITKPALMIADEPTTGLDSGVQHRVLSAIDIVRKELKLSMLIISNDQRLMEWTTDRVGVMSAGHIMEFGDTDKVLKTPGHPFTRAFVMSNPTMEVLRSIRERGLVIRGIPGSPPDMTNPPTGCRFQSRCEYAVPLCKEKAPDYREVEAGHWIRCHRYEELPEF